MDLGLHLPLGGSAASPETILAFAQEAERIGVASVWASDTLGRPIAQPIPFGGGISITMPPETASWYEGIETLAYLAARTDRLHLGTSVVIAAFQSPAALARRFATLDRLCDGRLLAGLGQGWIPQAFEAAGVSPKEKGARFEEHVQAMRAVWGPDPVRFDGRFYRIPESEIGPKPVRPGGPTVLAGATTAASATRAARLGLGILPVFGGWDGLRELVATFRGAAAAAGHDPGSLPVVVQVNGKITDGPVTDRQPLTGPADEVAGDLEHLRAVDIQHVVWNMFSPPDEQLQGMQRLIACL